MPELDLGFVKLPITRTGVRWLSVIAVLGAAAGVYQHFYGDPEQQITSLKDVNDRLASEVQEYGVHAFEDAPGHAQYDDTDGSVSLKVYRDHCVLIQRTAPPRGLFTRLILDLARVPVTASTQVPAPRASLFSPIALAQGQCRGHCLAQHPGQFRWWYGAQVQGGWVEVWRAWPDGCTHVQLFHSGSRLWATNPDGTPALRWTCCVH